MYITLLYSIIIIIKRVLKDATFCLLLLILSVDLWPSKTGINGVSSGLYVFSNQYFVIQNEVIERVTGNMKDFLRT